MSVDVVCCLRREIDWERGPELPDYLSPKTDELMSNYHDEYQRMFGVSFASMRAAMKDVSLAHCRLPIVRFDEILELNDDVWVAFADDDDLVLPDVTEIVHEKKDVFEDVGLIAWPVLNVPFSGFGRWSVIEPSRTFGCPSCGYAIKSVVFKRLIDGRQRVLLRDDHLSVHHYVWFSGYKYVFGKSVGAVRILHAASITAAARDALRNYKPRFECDRMIEALKSEQVCTDAAYRFVTAMKDAIYRELAGRKL